MKDTFGSRLRYFRTSLELTQKQLAEKSGVSRKQISDFEQHIQKKPRPQTIAKLAKGLNIRELDLLPPLEQQTFEEFSKSRDKLIEFKFTVPDIVVEEVTKLAEKSGRSFEDELNYFVHCAITEYDQKIRLEKSENIEHDIFERVKTLEEKYKSLLAEKGNESKNDEPQTKPKDGNTW